MARPTISICSERACYAAAAMGICTRENERRTKWPFRFVCSRGPRYRIVRHIIYYIMYIVLFVDARTHWLQPQYSDKHYLSCSRMHIMLYYNNIYNTYYTSWETNVQDIINSIILLTPSLSPRIVVYLICSILIHFLENLRVLIWRAVT